MPPRITSLSHREVDEGSGQRIFVNGEDLHEITAVWFGDEWSRDYRVDGTTVITAEVPTTLAAGTYYVVVASGDSDYSDVHDQCVIVVRPAGGGAAPTTFSLHSVAPAAVAVGRAADHWVKGSGLLSTSAVVLGSSACTFQATDDGTLVVSIPEQLRDVTPGTTARLYVYPKSGDALWLEVATYDTAPEPHSIGFLVWAASPDRVPTTGGTVTLEGDGLDSATHALLGDVECPIARRERGALVLDVPALHGLTGQFLVATVVNDTAVASNATSVGVRVTA